MDKKEFTAELKELLASMSEEEIEKTLNALTGCKAVIGKKNNREKGDKARLLSTVDGDEAELRFTGTDGKKGTIKAIGASLLTTEDFQAARKVLPPIEHQWWLYDGGRVTNDYSGWFREFGAEGKIRPVIVIEEINGDLQPGDVFSVNDESFRLLSPSLMIKCNCLSDSCTFNAPNYECSVLKLCVDGWYSKLVRENKASGGSAT